VALEMPSEFANGRALPRIFAWCRANPRAPRTRPMLGVGRQTANETRRHRCWRHKSLLTPHRADAGAPHDKFLLWVQRMLLKNRNLAAVAVAAKLARIAWAVEAKGKEYIPRPAA